MIAAHFLAAVLGTAAAASSAQSTPRSAPLTLLDIETQAAPEPIGIGEPAPRLSWKIGGTRRGTMQAAYRIVLATRPELAFEGLRNRHLLARVPAALPL